MYAEAAPSSYVRSLRFAAVLTAVGCARAFVQQTVSAWQLGSISDDAVLVASELVTNAVVNTGNTDQQPSYMALADVPIITVRLSRHRRLLLIEVWDTSAEPPILRQQTDGDEHGRGLHIVHALSERWGICFPKAGGKAVWAELAVSGDQSEPEQAPLRLSPTARAQSAVHVERLSEQPSGQASVPTALTATQA